MKKYKLVYEPGLINWWWYAYPVYFGWFVSPWNTGDLKSTKEELIETLQNKKEKVKNKRISEIVEIE